MNAYQTHGPSIYPVIPARMPESSHNEVNLRDGTVPELLIFATGKLPSMALDSGIPVGVTERRAGTVGILGKRGKAKSAFCLKLLLGCVLLGSQGCTTVPPWERGNLAKKEMSPSPTPSQSKLRDHIFFSREASQGGHSGSGGGCGCN